MTSYIVKRVAVIGAGVSGLPAIKHCLEEGFETVCFEMRSDLGGLWNYTQDVVKGWSATMKCTVSNGSKESLCYSDFPIPDDFPVYMPHEKVLEYLKRYAKNFNLDKSIRFDSQVIEITQTNDFKETGRWNITLKNTKTEVTTTETFDAVCVCGGNFSYPSTPRYEGQDLFAGTQLHSQSYRDGRGFEGKRAVVVGLGNSAVDIACDLSRVCKQVFLSTRRGTWIAGRLAPGGIPFDMYFLRNSVGLAMAYLPHSLVNYLMIRIIQYTSNFELLGLEPKHDVLHRHLVINDDLPAILYSGKVKLKGGIKRLNKDSVVFQDGSVEENIDVIVSATGYEIEIPFINHTAFQRKNAPNHLYKFVFPPEMEHPTMAIIGYTELPGSYLLSSELQSRWAVKVFKGEVKLPAQEVMEQQVSAWRKAFVTTSPAGNEAYEYPWVLHVNEVAEEIGCQPRLSKLIRSDPVLAWKMFFGPILPSFYRLVGPGAWFGARDNILNVDKRLFIPLRSRTVERGNWRTVQLVIRLTLLVIIITILLALIY